MPFKNQMLVTINYGRNYHFMYFLILAVLNHNKLPFIKKNT